MRQQSKLEVTADTRRLILAIRANQKQHTATFLKAWARYEKACIAWLDDQLVQVKNGKGINRYFPHPEPEDHSDDYETAVSMLSMHTEPTITIGWSDYQMYVEDVWDWSQQWAATNQTYGVVNG